MLKKVIFQKPSIVRQTLQDGWMNYIPLESSFSVDSKNGITFIFFKHFWAFYHYFSIKISKKFVKFY